MKTTECPQCHQPTTIDSNDGETLECVACDLRVCGDCARWVTYDSAEEQWVHAYEPHAECFLVRAQA